MAGRLRSDGPGGATKLNKVIFFAEFTHFRKHGSVISGCKFQKLPHGPAPVRLIPVRERLIEEGDGRSAKRITSVAPRTGWCRYDRPTHPRSPNSNSTRSTMCWLGSRG